MDDYNFSDSFKPPTWSDSAGYVEKLMDLVMYLIELALEGDPPLDPDAAGITFDIDMLDECYFLILAAIAQVYNRKVLDGLGHDSNGNRHELWTEPGDLLEGAVRSSDPVSVNNYFFTANTRR